MIKFFKALFILIKVGPQKIIDFEKEIKTDLLTGVYNRRGFFLKALQEERRAIQNSCKFSIIFFDIDGLKEVNDNHGHLAGDEEICQFSSLLKHSVKNVDVVSRWGGDEFIVLLPNTDYKVALKVALRIQKKSNSSFGISVYREGITISEMINNADKEMYKNKRAK